MHAPYDHEPGRPAPGGSASETSSPTASSARPVVAPWLTCESRPSAANACFAPVQAPLYPALARRLLAGVLDMVVCAWFFVLAVALVHLGNTGLPLHTEDLLARAAALTGVMFLLYFFITESSPLQASIGKRLMGMKVTDPQGGAPSFERAALRFGLTLLGLATAGLSFLPALRSRQGRCLQDRLTGTLVVMRDALPGQLRVHERVPHATDDRLSLAACVGLVLLVTQAALPWWQQQVVALRIERSLQASRSLTDALARHQALQGQVPDDLHDLGVALSLENGDARVERLGADGSFELRLDFAPVHGLRLRMTPPPPTDAGSARHRCRSIDVPSKLLPSSCAPVDTGSL